MNGRSQAKVSQDLIDMLLPETWSFGVTLHGTLDWDDHAVWNRRITKVLSPPVTKRTVRADVEALTRRRGFTKSIADVRTVNNKVLDRCYRVEEMSTRVIHTVGICVV